MEFNIENVALTTDGDIGIIKIDNPPENFLKKPDFIDIKVLKKWIQKSNLKGLVITGEGRNFSAGADIKNIASYPEHKASFKKSLKKGTKLLSFIENLSIPVVAAVNGVCFGGGFEIALSCHIRVCAENSYFSFPETELGLIPGLNGILRLSKKIERSKSLEMILTNDIIDAEKAFSLGIADYVVPKNETIDYSVKLLKKITANRSKELINFVVASLNNSRKKSLKKSMKKEAEFFCKLAMKESKNLLNSDQKN